MKSVLVVHGEDLCNVDALHEYAGMFLLRHKASNGDDDYRPGLLGTQRRGGALTGRPIPRPGSSDAEKRTRVQMRKQNDWRKAKLLWPPFTLPPVHLFCLFHF